MSSSLLEFAQFIIHYPSACPYPIFWGVFYSAVTIVGHVVRWLKYSLAFQQKWLKSILAFTVDGFHKLPFEMLQTDFLSRDAAVSIYERNQMIFQVLIGHILSEINTIQVINQPCPIITICFTTANNAISEVKQVLNT